MIVSLRQYFPHHMQEDSPYQQSHLEAMLAVMSRVSLKHYPVSVDYHCRSIAWIKTAAGEDHLVCLASLHKNDKTYHAEELMAKMIYELYRGDPSVVTLDNKLRVHRMYIDMEPCDGERYGTHHHCQQFFENGRFISDNQNIRRRVAFDPQSIIYWNMYLPPRTNSGSVRSIDWEREQIILGIDTSRLAASLDIQSIWQKCYILTPDHVNEYHHVKPCEINISDFFKDSAEYNEPAILRAKAFLTELVQDKSSQHYSEKLAKFIDLLLKDNNKLLLNQCAKALTKNFNFYLIMSIPGMNAERARLLLNLQTLWIKTYPESVNIEIRASQSYDAKLLQESPKPVELREIEKFKPTVRTSFQTSMHSSLPQPPVQPKNLADIPAKTRSAAFVPSESKPVKKRSRLDDILDSMTATRSTFFSVPKQDKRKQAMPVTRLNNNFKRQRTDSSSATPDRRQDKSTQFSASHRR